MNPELANVKRPQRWDVPYWSELTGEKVREMTSADVDALLEIPLFRQMDPTRFSAASSLRDILLNDARLRVYEPGHIVVRQGDYGSSAFIILTGSVRVVLDKIEDSLLGREAPRRKSLFEAFSQLWRNPVLPEVRHYGPGRARSMPGKDSPVPDHGGAVFVQDVTAIIRDKDTARLGPGEIFGEIAALSRTPRTTTVVADGRVELLEIRWQGLREIRLRSPKFQEAVDQRYRERSLKSHLRETPMFGHLDDASLELVAQATEFRTFGHFDWYAAYTKQRLATVAERLQQEPLVAREGHYANGVYLVRSGFARLSETYNHGERTISYLGRGQTFGFEEVARNWRNQSQLPFRRSLRALGYVDVLFVPTTIVEQYVLPTLPAAQWPAEVVPAPAIPAEMMEFIVDRRLINGTATMIIDLDRCTRCDDCVRACAATHDNNPRFLRHGPVNDRFMIANACMHCLDPVCMIGCPTGAIQRESAHGRVVINDNTCIGCATCANSCPYDNIQMVTPRNAAGQPYYDGTTNQPIQKAAKCDLCASQITGPACARACPHDALFRVNLRDLDNLGKILSRQ